MPKDTRYSRSFQNNLEDFNSFQTVVERSRTFQNIFQKVLKDCRTSQNILELFEDLARDILSHPIRQCPRCLWVFVCSLPWFPYSQQVFPPSRQAIVPCSVWHIDPLSVGILSQCQHVSFLVLALSKGIDGLTHIGISSLLRKVKLPSSLSFENRKPSSTHSFLTCHLIGIECACSLAVMNKVLAYGTIKAFALSRKFIPR